MGWTPPRYSKFSTVANTTVATLQLVANQPYLYANSESTNRLHVRSSGQAPFPPLRTLQPDACSPGLITIFWLHVFTTSARACTPGPQGARKKLWSGDRQPPSNGFGTVPDGRIPQTRPLSRDSLVHVLLVSLTLLRERLCAQLMSLFSVMDDTVQVAVRARPFSQR